MFAGAIAAVREACYFDGVWADVSLLGEEENCERRPAAIIKDGAISWAGGSSSPVVILSPTKLITHLAGKTRTAERLADGSLQWDTGGVWAPFEEGGPSSDAARTPSPAPEPVPPVCERRSARSGGRQARTVSKPARAAAGLVLPPAPGSARAGAQGTASARKKSLASPRRTASSAAQAGSTRSPRAPRPSAARQNERLPPAKAALDQSAPLRHSKAPGERPPAPLQAATGRGGSGGAKNAPPQPVPAAPRRGLLFAKFVRGPAANQRYITASPTPLPTDGST